MNEMEWTHSKTNKEDVKLSMLFILWALLSHDLAGEKCQANELVACYVNNPNINCIPYKLSN